MHRKQTRSEKDLSRRIQASLEIARLLKQPPIHVVVSKKRKHEWLAANRFLARKVVKMGWRKGDVVSLRPLTPTEKTEDRPQGFRCAVCGSWRQGGRLISQWQDGFYAQIRVCKSAVCRKKIKLGKIRFAVVPSSKKIA